MPGVGSHGPAEIGLSWRPDECYELTCPRCGEHGVFRLDASWPASMVAFFDAHHYQCLDEPGQIGKGAFFKTRGGSQE